MNWEPRRKFVRCAAFTLVELLVVIGIIAVLISMLLPSLNKVRESAVSLNCQANLRQIGNAVQLYVLANRGSMVCPSFCYDQPFDYPADAGLRHYNPGDGLTNPLAYLTYSSRALPGFRSVTNAANEKPVTTCPIFWTDFAFIYWNQGNMSNTGSKGYKWGGSYAFNSHLDRSMYIPTKKSLVKFSKIKRTSMRFMFGEGTGIDLSVSASVPGSPAPFLWYGHLKRTNMMFCDGHVESLLQSDIPVTNNYPNRAPWIPENFGEDTCIPSIW